jgi:hypothetical protein
MNKTVNNQVFRHAGWTIRIYHNFNENQTEVHQTLCQVYCQNDHVDLCHVRDVAESLNRFESAAHRSPIPDDLGHLNRMIWRYLPLMDPLVDVFMSRDSDSDVNQREVAAVGQWLQSNSTFHVIRDHQYHKEAILGGNSTMKMNELHTVR